MRLLYQSDDLSFFQAKISVPISVTGFVIMIEGTSDAAQTLALNEIGRLQYRKRDKLMVDVDVAQLAQISDLIGGWHWEDFDLAGTTELGFYLPRWLIMPQVETILPEDNATITIDFIGAFDTAMASAVTSLYAVEDEGAQAYDLRMVAIERDFNGTGRHTITYDALENIGAVWMTDTQTVATGTLTAASTNVTRVQGNVGTFQLDATRAALLAKTNLFTEAGNGAPAGDSIANGWNLMAEVFRADSDEISSKLSETMTLHIDTGGDVHPVVVLAGFDFNPDKLQETAAATRQRRNFKVGQKALQGKTRTQRVVGELVY